MSWSFKYIGTRAALNHKVQAQTQFPQALKDIVAAIATAPGLYPPAARGLEIETYGHIDSVHGGSVSKFELREVDLLPEPPADPDYSFPASEAEFVEYYAAATLAREGKPLPDDASPAAKFGYGRDPAPSSPP